MAPGLALRVIAARSAALRISGMGLSGERHSTNSRYGPGTVDSAEWLCSLTE